MRSLFAVLFTAAILISEIVAADLIIHNANIRTLDEKQPRATAVAIRDGRFIAVGDRAAIDKFATDDTIMIDAGGRLVVPGFNDSHVHLHGIGNWFSHLDMRDERVVDAIAKRIEDAAEVVRRGRWILGSGISTRNFDTRILPSIPMLDRVSAEHPVLIYVDGYTSALVNGMAFRIAGVSIADADLPKNKDGEPIGIVTGQMLDRIRRIVPSNYGTDTSAIIEAATNHAARLGVTSVQDVHSDDLFTTLNELDRTGRLKTRVYDCIGIADRKLLIDQKIIAATGNGMVRRGCVKSDTVDSREEIPELAAKFADADKGGLQIMVHAIGGRDVGNTISTFEALVERNGRRDRRFRVEHAFGISASDRERAKRVDAILSMQPYLFWRGENSTSDDFRGLIDGGVRLAFGSDASMVSLDPILGIHAAVNSGRGSVSVFEAVRAYTVWAAFAEFQESEKGTIAVGKLADLVMLNADIFSIDRRQIRDTKVAMTVVNGRVVYRANGMFDNLKQGAKDPR